MVFDNIRNAQKYYGLSKRICTALKYLEETDFTALKAGRREIDGDNIFALVQHYDSRLPENGVWEAHRRYIDIHYIVDGTEQIGYSEISFMTESTEYDAAGDCILFSGEGRYLIAKKETFAIFWPQDVHSPCIAAKNPSPVKKVVIKVLL